ncbi:hypothetical protein ACWDXV_16570 [Nocardia nova]
MLSSAMPVPDKVRKTDRRVLLRYRAFVASVLFLLSLIVPLAVASAAPVDCASLPGRISAFDSQADSLKGKIAAHNAQYGSINTKDSAAVAAYNAEADSLNSRRAVLLSQQSSLNAEAQACGSANRPGPVPDLNSQPPGPSVPQTQCAAARIDRVETAQCTQPPPAHAPTAKGQGAPSLRSNEQTHPNINTNVEPLTKLLGSIIPGRGAAPTSAEQAASLLGAPATNTTTPAFLTKNPRCFTPQALAEQGIELRLSPTQQASLASAAPVVSTLLKAPVAQGIVAQIPGRSVIALGNPANTGDALGNASAAFAKLPGGGWAIGLPREEEFGRSQGSIAYLTPNDWGQKGESADEFPGVTGRKTGYDSGHGVPRRAGGPGKVPQLLLPELVNINRGGLARYERHLAGLANPVGPGITRADIMWVKIPYFLPGNAGEIPDYVEVLAWSPNQGWAFPPAVFQNY